MNLLKYLILSDVRSGNRAAVFESVKEYFSMKTLLAGHGSRSRDRLQKIHQGGGRLSVSRRD